jgi:hypothetical protein
MGSFERFGAPHPEMAHTSMATDASCPRYDVTFPPRLPTGPRFDPSSSHWLRDAESQPSHEDERLRASAQ